MMTLKTAFGIGKSGKAEWHCNRGNQGMFCYGAVFSFACKLSFCLGIRAVSSPSLARAALRFLSISPTEAAVELAYSHLKLLHSDLRNRLNETSVDALMFVSACFFFQQSIFGLA